MSNTLATLQLAHASLERRFNRIKGMLDTAEPKDEMDYLHEMFLLSPAINAIERQIEELSIGEDHGNDDAA